MLMPVYTTTPSHKTVFPAAWSSSTAKVVSLMAPPPSHAVPVDWEGTSPQGDFPVLPARSNAPNASIVHTAATVGLDTI